MKISSKRVKLDVKSISVLHIDGVKYIKVTAKDGATQTFLESKVDCIMVFFNE